MVSHKGLSSALITLMSVILAVMAGTLTLTTMPLVEAKLFPVMSDWTVTEAYVEGNDLIVKGTVIKRRDCTYIPPPRALAPDGAPLLVRSYSPTAQISWPAGAGPQQFGPWRVVNGAERDVQFFFQHSCHAAYDIVTPLGIIRKLGQDHD